MDDLYSVEEWVDYISRITMIEMISHAKVIGSASLYDELTSQGYDADEVMEIYNSLAQRFLDLEMRVPDMMDGARVNFRLLASDLSVSDGEVI